MSVALLPQPVGGPAIGGAGAGFELSQPGCGALSSHPSFSCSLWARSEGWPELSVAEAELEGGQKPQGARSLTYTEARKRAEDKGVSRSALGRTKICALEEGSVRPGKGSSGVAEVAL